LEALLPGVEIFYSFKLYKILFNYDVY